MTYKSPFDDIIDCISLMPHKKFDNLSERMDCTAKLSEIISETRRSINYTGKGIDERIALALNPARMIRSAIDTKIDSVNSDNYLALVRQGVATGLSIYGKHEDASRQVDKFEEMVREVNPSMLNNKVVQLFDSTTWVSTHPRKSEVSARVILEATKGRDILMIALAHGGVAAGLDVFGMYNASCASENSSFYPVRLSTDKMRDEDPMIDIQEKLYLQQQAEDREVVIFDEDSSSGKTMRIASNFFYELFGKDVIARVNNTIR